MKYSAANNAFYLPEIHGTAIPYDAVEITNEEHRALVSGQSEGRLIRPDAQGQPTLVDRQQPTSEEQLAAERAGMIVSRFQARAALHLAGLLVQAEAAVNAAPPLAQLAWQDAQEFRRDSPTIAALAGAIGLNELQIDDLFRAAANISA